MKCLLKIAITVTLLSGAVLAAAQVVPRAAGSVTSAFEKTDASLPDEMIAIGEGMAPLNDDVAAAEEEAVWDAKRNAVEQAAGLFVHGRALGRNFMIEEDEIQGRTDGFVRRWEIVPDSQHVEDIGNGRLLHIKVRATVALLSVIRRLSDMADVYNDLERPRIRITIDGDAQADRIQNVLVGELRARHFDVASEGPAEVILKGHLTTTPTLRLGDRNTPHQLAELVAACRTRLSVQLVSTTSEEVLFTAVGEGAGQSFQSDAEAEAVAAEDAATDLLRQSDGLFVQHLFVRWARERQEGYTAVVRVTGLNARHLPELEEALREMRGFRRIVSEASNAQGVETRFVTRLDLPSLRRRLGDLIVDLSPLTVTNQRGPLILCAASRAHGLGLHSGLSHEK